MGKNTWKKMESNHGQNGQRPQGIDIASMIEFNMH
jgi:hypothetical protein